MCKIKIKKVTLIIAIFAIMIVTLNFVEASSLSIFATKTSLTVGNSATITVTGNDAIGKVNISSSNSNIISVSSGSLWVEESASFKITAKAVGNATITITPADMSTSSGQTASVGAKSITIYSKAVYVDTRSKDNNLSSLTVEGYEIAFDTNNTSYNIDASYDVEKLNINAATSDAKASVKIEGNDGLVPGENIIKVICTAENGTQKIYEIKVNKSKNPQDINANLKNLSVINSTLKNEFAPENSEYLLEDVDGSVTSLILNYEPEVEGVKIEIIGNDKLEVGLNHVIIKVTSKDESVTKQYNIIFYKSEEISPLTQVKEKNMLDFFYENKLVILCLAVILILIIVIIILLFKNKRYKNNLNNQNCENEETIKKRHRRNNIFEDSKLEESNEVEDKKDNYTISE